MTASIKHPKTGDTLLHAACRHGHTEQEVEIVEILVKEKKLDVDALNYDGLISGASGKVLVYVSRRGCK